MISNLLHLVGLRPRVYHTLTNFKMGQGGLAPPPPPQYANVKCGMHSTVYFNIHVPVHNIMS